MKSVGGGYPLVMTAPGQEPDEITTAEPKDDEESNDPPADDKPDLSGIGDNHMPEDLREAERERKD